MRLSRLPNAIFAGMQLGSHTSVNNTYSNQLFRKGIV